MTPAQMQPGVLLRTNVSFTHSRFLCINIYKKQEFFSGMTIFIFLIRGLST